MNGWKNFEALFNDRALIFNFHLQTFILIQLYWGLAHTKRILIHGSPTYWILIIAWFLSPNFSEGRPSCVTAHMKIKLIYTSKFEFWRFEQTSLTSSMINFKLLHFTLHVFSKPYNFARLQFQHLSLHFESRTLIIHLSMSRVVKRWYCTTWGYPFSLIEYH